MARKGSRSQFGDPESESREISETAVSGKPIGKKVSKTQAVREALRAGFEMPTEGTDFIRDRFGIVMDNQRFSTVKSNLKKRESEGGAGKPRGKPGRKKRETVPTVAESGDSTSRSQPTNGEADLLTAIEAMKPLVASLGVEKVKRIAELLG